MTIDELFAIANRADHMLAWHDLGEVTRTLTAGGAHPVWVAFAIKLATMHPTPEDEFEVTA